MPLGSIMGGVIQKVRALEPDPRRTFWFVSTSCLACDYLQFPILSDLVFRATGLEGLKIGLVDNMALADFLPQGLVARILQAGIVGSILHKIANRLRPFEARRDETESVLAQAADAIRAAITGGGDPYVKYCHTLLRAVEGRCEKVAEDLLGNQREPDLADGVALMEERRFKHCFAG